MTLKRVREQLPNEESGPKPVFSRGGKGLYVEDLTGLMRDSETWGRHENPVATWASAGALIDARAYKILQDHCGSDKEKLDNYLGAILDFEVAHSDNEERHLNRTPIEKEILHVLETRGYFHGR